MADDLVLGGSGFLGSALAGAVAARGRSVVAVGRRTPDAVASGIRWIARDLHRLSQDDLYALVADAEVVHHLAWSNLPAQAEADPCADQAANVGFTVRLLAAVQRSGSRLVFVSSGGTVYGPSGGQRLREDHPLRPVSAYGAAKAAAEVYAGLFNDAYGCDVRIARLANPFGHGQGSDRLQGALSRFARQALAGRELEIWGDGEVVRDYLHVDDAVAGLQALAYAERSSLGARPVFNIGSGQGASLNQLVDLLSARLRRPVAVLRREGRKLDVPHNVLCIQAAADRLDWRPGLTLEQGVDRMLDQLAGAAADTPPVA